MSSDPAPTLASLARELGVHVSTVSRALSEPPSGISSSMVDQVRHLAMERGYRSNLAARALRTGRSLVIGMLVPRLTDAVLATVYAGVDEAAMDAGYATLVANTLDRPDLRQQRLQRLLARQVDGVIVADSRYDSNIIGALEAARVPHVLALRCLPDRLSIGTDDRLGGRLIGEHLLSLGHRRFGVVAGDTRASTGDERTQGFLDVCAEAGVHIPGQLVVPCAFDLRSGSAAAAQVLDADPDVTAIFATSDDVALGVLATLRDRGRSVPDDIALVGYNNLDLAAALPVPLTTVDSRLVEVGRAAMSALLAVIGGRSASSVRLTPRLIVRSSSGSTR
ncbi:MAG: LacI family DNA-binding transcriptional regulator [Ornithinimicrobium sp.]|uniref:LacI family DNA-binding transcriptional regulator n=1 Tax=Ornithinimicrobium sp. TaxID=1977084 RepID=UPI0026E0AAFA|nr:LacI family DNA-binding transcriptional regulator [Ornithinimicrobium sp.]MDO5739854.1 LacI family DNA-binding transcriptional regulator [Ornithinimicrobium sp.]